MPRTPQHNPESIFPQNHIQINKLSPINKYTVVWFIDIMCECLFICSKLICGYYWISNSQLSTTSDVQMHIDAVPIEFSSHFIPFFVFNFKIFAKWTVTSYLINVVHRLIILFIQSIWNWKKLFDCFSWSLFRSHCTILFYFVWFFFVADFFDDPHSVDEWIQFHCSYFGIGLGTEAMRIELNHIIIQFI